MFCGDVTSGASYDIERASDLARRMVCEWGMSEEIGPIKYTENEETLFLGREVTKSRDHSEALANRIDEEVRRVLDVAYQDAVKIIDEHDAAVERVAAALMERETLTGEQVAKLVRGEALEPLPDEPKPEASPTREHARIDQPAADAADAELPGEAGMNPDVLPAS